MVALKYKIEIVDSSFHAIHGMKYDIDEIAVEYLGATINKTGIYFHDKLDGRLALAKDAEEIELPSRILDTLEEIKISKGKEKEILKELNLI